jgi:TonB family protein
MRIGDPRILVAAAGAAAAWAVAGSALPQPETPTGGAAKAPPSMWISAPSAAQLREVSPPGGARAVMRCRVAASGELGACETLNETPAGSGFAAAIAKLAPCYRLTHEAAAGIVPGGAIGFSVDTFVHDKPADWVRKPSARDLAAVWPPAAQRTGSGGWAVISCLANTQGVLLDCFPLRESPPGAGFGSAAVALTPQLLMKPATYKGQPAPSVISIPIEFKRASVNYNQPVPATELSPAMAWPEAPTYADMIAAYPKKARAAGQAGRASLSCGFDGSGRLVGCSTITEDPKDDGFADAARSLAHHFRADLKTPDGRAISRARIQLPFFFDPASLSDAKPLIGKPKWQSLPASTDTDTAFGEILKTGLGTVRVSLSCRVQQGGTVTDCTVAGEDPPGKGVGTAALTLAPTLKVSTWTIEGLPVVGGTIRVPLRLEGPGVAPPAASP